MEYLIGICLVLALLYWWFRGHSLAAVLMGAPMALLGLSFGGNVSGLGLAMIGAVVGMLLACVPWLNAETTKYLEANRPRARRPGAL